LSMFLNKPKSTEIFNPQKILTAKSQKLFLASFATLR
jgi:hypothetical protein